MAAVSNDLSQLLDLYTKLSRTIENIHSTQISMMRSCERLCGNGWRDAKSRELEDIVQDCLQALSGVEQGLSRGAYVVRQLGQSLAEYDSINLESGLSGELSDSRAGGRNGSSSAGLTENVFGIACNGTLPAQHQQVVTDRFINAQENVRNVFSAYADQLVIQDFNFPTDGLHPNHYSPISYPDHLRGVYFNAAADSSDSSNLRGAGTTFYHELAHMIDHAAGDFETFVSDNDNYRAALEMDRTRLMTAYNAMTPEQRVAWSQEMFSTNRTHSVQDLLNGISGGQIDTRWGHDSEYWQDPGSLEAESFAHFFEASMGARDKLALLQHYFPNTYEAFNSIIADITPSTLHRTRTLRR